MKEIINYVGFLANVDSSILGLKLEHGFHFDIIRREQGIKSLSYLVGMDNRKYYQDLLLNYPSIITASGALIVIKNSYEIEVENNQMQTRCFNQYWDNYFMNVLVGEYLRSKLKLMRLFKEGNITIPVAYYYTGCGPDSKLNYSSYTSNQVLIGPILKIEDNEKNELQQYINGTELPFKQPHLDLAHQNYDLSYDIINKNLAFLSLMISMECLYNPSDSELRYRVSRNAAVLLGRKLNSDIVFKDIKRLYDIRSNIVHTGETKSNLDNDLQTLRHYVRESIKIMNEIGKSKDEILNTLNRNGFSECIL